MDSGFAATRRPGMTSGYDSYLEIIGLVLLRQHRRPRKTERAEQADERRQALAPIGLDVEVGVVEKALAAAQADAVLAHVALDDRGRRIALAGKRLGQVAAGVIENVAAAPVDELQHAEHGEAEAETVFDR